MVGVQEKYPFKQSGVISSRDSTSSAKQTGMNLRRRLSPPVGRRTLSTHREHWREEEEDLAKGNRYDGEAVDDKATGQRQRSRRQRRSRTLRLSRNEKGNMRFLWQLSRAKRVLGESRRTVSQADR